MEQWRAIMNSGSVLGYFLQVLPITCCVGLAYVVVRIIVIKRKKYPVIWLNEIIRLAFACYLTGLVSLVILPANFWIYFFDGVFLGWWEEMPPFFGYGGFNLVPSIVKCIRGELTIGAWGKTMFVGNVAMFLPLGFFLSCVIERVDFRKAAVISITVPLTVELCQLVLGRSFDTDDLLCNFVGIMSGFLIFCALKSIRKSCKKRNGVSGSDIDT